MHIHNIKQALSWVPLKLIPTVNDKELSVATGFFYLHKGRTFLITNYHVASGRHPESQKALHSSLAYPDSLVLTVAMESASDEQTGAKKLHWKPLKLAMYAEGKPDDPVWIEHPIHGSRFDVVAIPLSGLDATRITAANAESLDLDLIQVYPSMDAFVLGYPRGMSGGGQFPIWKRATIATEPDFDLDGLPKLYIDTATREGMSGSPVYAQEVGYWLPEGETDPSKWTIGKGRRFIGVYSGRLGAEDEFKAQLGLVWKESGLIELLDSAPPDIDEN